MVSSGLYFFLRKSRREGATGLLKPAVLHICQVWTRDRLPNHLDRAYSDRMIHPERFSGTSEEVVVARLYEELRELAHRYRIREGAGATLHTTELVHEAWLRMGDDADVAARGRAYFFGAAAQAMRRVLVDAARRRSAVKRGGEFARVTLGAEQVAVDGYASDLLDLDRALSLLDREHPRLARVVELRFFGGLTVEETAAALGVSARTVKGDWALARAWLHETLDGGGEPKEG